MQLKQNSNNFINGIIFAISYFSSIPLGLKKFEADEKFYGGVIFGLPLVGLLLGLIVVCLFLFLNLFFPIFYSAFLSSIFYFFAYGFLHLEAVADTVDGLYASLSKKEVYDLMKNPEIGAMGAIATILSILVKTVVLSYLLYLQAYLFVILSLVFSRLTLYFILELEIHPKSSFLISMQRAKKNKILLDIIFLPLKWLIFFIVKKVSKTIGFINGDVSGFTIELVEIILLHIFLLVVL